MSLQILKFFYLWISIFAYFLLLEWTKVTRYARWVERNLVARYAWSQWHSILEKASCFEREGERREKQNETDKEKGDEHGASDQVKNKMIHNAWVQFVVEVVQMSFANSIASCHASSNLWIFKYKSNHPNIREREREKEWRKDHESRKSSHPFLDLLGLVDSFNLFAQLRI